jgi:hypothetical protein
VCAISFYLSNGINFLAPTPNKVLKGKKLLNGSDLFVGRPGKEMAPFNFNEAKRRLEEQWGAGRGGVDQVREVDVMSHAM